MKNRIRIKRWHAGLKQSELAEKLRCSLSYLSMVENGQVETTEDFKWKTANILQTSVEELFPIRHQINIINTSY